jgi:translation initiation factor IF-2
MSVKVSSLAKELGVSVEDVLEQLRKLYVDVEDEKSTIDDKIVGLVCIKLGRSKVVEKPPKKEKKTKTIPSSKGKKQKVELKTKGKKEKKEEKRVKTKEKKKEKGKPDTPKLEPVAKKAEKSAKPEPEPVTSTPKTAKPSKYKPTIEIVEKAAIRRPTFKRPSRGARLRPVIEVIEKGAKGKFRPGKAGGKTRFKTPFSKAGIPEVKQPDERKVPQKIQVQIPINIRTLSPRINMKPNLVIQYLMDKGAFVNINQDLDEDTVREIMAHFGYELELHKTTASMEKELVAEHHEKEKASGEPRAPVVTFMGHVDHGKTSLLDYIRKTMVTKGEKGGITQHIGAYKVKTANGSVTFLDTPGHAAFTAMRARGANATDVVVLVVAADDGVMPQTKEAIDHARAAEVPIVVAINKCDLAGANPDKVIKGLQAEGLVTEKLGGKTVMVEVSAITGEGVDGLVEMLMLESEMLELKANPKLKARGVVIESRKSPGQGVVATLLVQNGTLHPGDIVLCGSNYGKVKAMIDDTRERVSEALPSTPVEVLGLQGVPFAGDEFFVVKNEKKAKTLSLLKQDESRSRTIAGSQRVTLEDLHNRILEGSMKELKMILKGDVQGSVEALQHSLEDLATSEVRLNMIHSAVGNINESDIMLAIVSNAVIIGFNVKTDTQAEELAKSENVDIHTYDIIYEAIADVKAAMEGLLEPEEKEILQGIAQIREVFSASKIGKAAGCMVTKGTIHRKDHIRIKRGQEIIYKGHIHALKRFKDDVKDVKEGFECGISIKGFNDIRKNDTIEAFVIEKIARRLEK